MRLSSANISLEEHKGNYQDIRNEQGINEKAIDSYCTSGDKLRDILFTSVVMMVISHYPLGTNVIQRLVWIYIWLSCQLT
jgi:hypothetical protein